MIEAAVVPKPLRTWRPMALWTAGILLALGLAWFIGAVAVPMWITRKAVVDYSVSYCFADDPPPYFRAIDRLGGPELAARKFSLYLRLPRKLAPHRPFAVELLGHCGQWGVPELIRALRSDTPEIQRVASTMLEEYGPQASASIPELVRLIRLGNGGVPSPSANDADDLDVARICSYRFPGQSMRRALPRDEAAFYALAAMGPDAMSAMASLVDSPKFRAAAAYWLSTQGDAATPLLAGWLGSPDESSRMAAVEALAKTCAKEQHVFLAALKDPSAKVRRKALQIMRSSLPASADLAGEASRLLVSDPDEEVRFTALKMLPKEPGPFIKALADQAPRVRALAATCLSQLGPLAVSAVPALTAELRDQDPTARACAAEALGRIGAAADVTVEELARLLDTQDTTGPLGEREASLLGADPLLRFCVYDSELFRDAPRRYDSVGYSRVPPSSRLAAVVALGMIGPAAAKAVPSIELLVKDQDDKVRSAAAEALRKIRGEVKEPVK